MALEVAEPRVKSKLLASLKRSVELLLGRLTPSLSPREALEATYYSILVCCSMLSTSST